MTTAVKAIIGHLFLGILNDHSTNRNLFPCLLQVHLYYCLSRDPALQREATFCLGSGRFKNSFFKKFRIFRSHVPKTPKKSHHRMTSLRGKIRANCKSNKTMSSGHAMKMSSGREFRDVSRGAAVVLEPKSNYRGYE